MVLISVCRFQRAGLPRISRAHCTPQAPFWQAKSDACAYFSDCEHTPIRSFFSFFPKAGLLPVYLCNFLQMEISVRYSELFELDSIEILRRQTGIPQVFADMGPLLQATVVEHFKGIRNDKRNVPVAQTFLE